MVIRNVSHLNGIELTFVASMRFKRSQKKRNYNNSGRNIDGNRGIMYEMQKHKHTHTHNASTKIDELNAGKMNWDSLKTFDR